MDLREIELEDVTWSHVGQEKQIRKKEGRIRVQYSLMLNIKKFGKEV
jgi:hypothetical protein